MYVDCVSTQTGLLMCVSVPPMHHVCCICCISRWYFTSGGSTASVDGRLHFLLCCFSNSFTGSPFLYFRCYCLSFPIFIFLLCSSTLSHFVLYLHSHLFFIFFPHPFLFLFPVIIPLLSALISLFCLMQLLLLQLLLLNTQSIFLSSYNYFYHCYSYCYSCFHSYMHYWCCYL